MLTLESTTPEPPNNFLQSVSTYQMTTQKSSTKIEFLWLLTLESTTPELVVDTKINHTSTHQMTTLKSSTKIGFLWLLTLESTTP